ncbi:MAG: CaiB/BaiF CoA-transferase family protein [Actinomycetota bacterium]|nr:CaiB/BaiF CoA-transferase family protein [Actinomycetota bacterium]
MTVSLQGIRVLDLSQLFPGPYCTMILADLGAEVIKVEPLGTGDHARAFEHFFNQINRNKKSLALNLKDARAQEIFHGLARGADVVIEGFRPGTASRLGVDFETLSELNPRLIYCSISGFGQDGPYLKRPGHDINYMSIGGTLGLTRDSQDRPVVPGLEIVDVTSGLNATIAILAALLARENTGKGQFIDISMLDVTVSLIPMEVGYCLATGEPPPAPTLEALPHYGVFETADGDYLALGIVHEDWFWRELCDALELEDIKDLNTAERALRKEELESRLKEIFRSLDMSEWLSKLEGYDIPFAKINDVDEALQDPQVLHRDMVVEIPAGNGTARCVGSPLKLFDTPPRFDDPTPGLGEHTEPLLKELGLKEDEIQELRNAGAIQ